MNNIEFLTIQERIELFRKNMAFSPSDAARKVASIAEAAMSDLMDDDKFVNKGKSKLDDRSVTYSEHCGSLSAAISKKLSKTDKTPYESRFGNTYSDYIYIAALSIASLPHRLENGYYNYMPPMYYNLRMTLGNYLDALIDISYDSEKDKPNTRRANQYRKLKKELSKIIDLATPLCEAIGILLNQYGNSHAELDRLSHIQRCKSDLDRFIQMDEMREEYIEYEGDSRSDEEEYEAPDDNAAASECAAEDGEIDEQDEQDEQEYCYEDIAPVGFVTDDDFGDDFDDDLDEEFYDDDYDDFDADDFDDDPEPEDTELSDKKMLIAAGDPDAYYLSEARKLPDISAKSPEKLYYMGNKNPNLLADNDYSPEGFKARAAELPPKFREIADEVITAEGIANAFKGMDAATDKLYRLLIEPFAEIERYRFVRHLSSEV